MQGPGRQVPAWLWLPRDAHDCSDPWTVRGVVPRRPPWGRAAGGLCLPGKPMSPTLSVRPAPSHWMPGSVLSPGLERGGNSGGHNCCSRHLAGARVVGGALGSEPPGSGCRWCLPCCWRPAGLVPPPPGRPSGLGWPPCLGDPRPPFQHRWGRASHPRWALCHAEPCLLPPLCSPW